MKNKINIFLLLILSTFFNQKIIFADIFNFETSEIQILDKGNTIKAINGGKVVTDDSVEIYADEFEYNKIESSLTAIGNIELIDENNKLTIKAEKIFYLKNQDKIFVDSKMNAVIDSKYYMDSEKVVYDRKKMQISSEEKTEFKDYKENNFTFEKFRYNILQKKIRGKKISYIDNQNDQYNFQDAIIDLNSDEIIGKDLIIRFDNSTFGNKGNNPRLKGNTVYSNKKSTILKKGVFTTCKKREKCPPWVISAEEVKHDKVKKIINYKNAWLKVYDMPVLYFPKFFHPDPSVKRQSGFLIPSMNNSSNFGMSVNIPYFHVISENKDLTFKPRIYSDQNIILQSEYRQANKESDHIFDASLKQDDSKIHFFSNSIINLGLSAFDASELEFNLQKTSNDTYLKAYNIQSPLIKDDSTLNSFLDFEGYRGDLSVNASVQVFEDLSKTRNDRFEYVFPSFDILKNIVMDDNFGGSLLFKTSGYQKQYSTNLYEASLVNSLIFTSDPIFKESGLKNNYKFSLSNPNSLTQDSSNTNENKHEILSSFLFESSYPMKKEGESYDSYLTPILQFRYSPNKTKNIRGDDRRIDINNIYSFDRIGSTSSVEGGQSMTIGSGYKRSDKSNNELISLDLATVFRDTANPDLPTKSTIGNKTSDIVGNFIYKPNSALNFEYDFSFDNDLNRSNYDSFKTKLSVNNFVTTFEYLEENNIIGNESFLANQTSIGLDDSNSINFSTRRNKKTDVTEFYKLAYQYKNDCLTAAIEYNKHYYEDSDLQPEENIFFSLTIIPFGTATGPSLK